MTRFVSLLALAFVALLPIGRGGLPLNAQWGDLLFPLLAFAFFQAGWGGRLVGRGDWPLAAYLALTLTAALVSPDPVVGLEQLAKQVYLASVFVVLRRLFSDASLSNRLHRTFVAVVAALGTVSLLVVFLRLPRRVPLSMLGEIQVLPVIGMVRRLRGALESPELFGNALLVAFVLALALRQTASKRSRLCWTAIITLLAVSEFLTYSHSVAGFAVATVLFLVASIRRRVLRAAASVTALMIVLVVNVASVGDFRPAGPLTHYETGSISLDILGARIEGRRMSYFALKEVAWTTFLGHPLIGVGPGRFKVETERAFREGRLPKRYRSVPAHSDLAGRFAETGALGGLSLLVLWASWISRLRSSLAAQTSPLTRAAAAAAVGLLVNSLNADVMNFRVLWLVLASALPSRDEHGPRADAMDLRLGSPPA